MYNLSTFRELDNLVLPLVGYVKYEWEEECGQYPGATYVGDGCFSHTLFAWVPKEAYERTEEEWWNEREAYMVNGKFTSEYCYYNSLEDYIDQNDFSYTRESYSSSFSSVEELTDYFTSRKVTPLDIQICKESIYVHITNKEVNVGKLGYSHKYCDSSVNSLPLALCLLVLKYNKVEFTLGGELL
jgi:hypothetical protein